MPQLTASLETAERFAALPKTDIQAGRPPYLVHVIAEKAHVSAAGNNSTAIQFQVDDPDYFGRFLPGMNGWYYVPVSGARFFDTINALGGEWTCTACGRTSTDLFKKEKAKGSYQYFCPACGKRADVSVNQSWVGLSARAVVDVEKMQNSDEDRNVVRSLLPKS